MRIAFAILCILAACDPAGRPQGVAPAATGIYPDPSTSASDTSDEPRLDLGATPPLPDLPADSTSTSPEDSTSTSETGSTAEPAGTSGGPEDTSTSTSDDGNSSSSSGSESSSSGSTGEPVPICGDGKCDPAERAPCWDWDGNGWGPGFCPDCMEAPECVAVLDCPCTPEAAAVKSWCFADPLPACSATAPGGACEKSTALAFYMWNAKCG